MSHMNESLNALSRLRDAVMEGHKLEVVLMHIELLEHVVAREGKRAHSEGIWQGRGETPNETRIRERDESIAVIREGGLENRIQAATPKDKDE